MRKYVPELSNFPAKYIYEPWKAPIADQNKVRVRRGAAARRRARAIMRAPSGPAHG